MWSLAHLFQMIALALGDAPDALLLCIRHELAPDQQGRTLHEKNLDRYFRFVLEQAEFLFPNNPVAMSGLGHDGSGLSRD
jgi:hypothetical protein